jgi:nucleotide-binding universal stress UspA family protein
VKVLCAVDTSARAARVADAARRLARAMEGSIVLVHVFDPMMVPAAPTRELNRLVTTEQIEEHERRRARAALADAADRGGDMAQTTVFAEGDPRSLILDLLRAHDVRLLVVGSAARKPLDRIMQGSMSADLVRGASCPVAILTDDAVLPDGGPVLAGYDGSDHSLRAARHAAAIASALQRDLVLVHVVGPGEAGARPDEELALELHAAAGACASTAAGRPAPRLDVAVAVEHGDPVERLTEAADERGASLIVVGNRGRNAVTAAVLGSVSAGVIRRSDRLVVVAGPRSERAGA